MCSVFPSKVQVKTNIAELENCLQLFYKEKPYDFMATIIYIDDEY